MIDKKFIGFILNVFAVLFLFTIAGFVNQLKFPFLSKTEQKFLNNGEYESSMINIEKFSGTSVRDFGAVGDGIHDDTDAIQRCFMAVGLGLASRQLSIRWRGELEKQYNR